MKIFINFIVLLFFITFSMHPMNFLNALKSNIIQTYDSFIWITARFQEDHEKVRQMILANKNPKYSPGYLTNLLCLMAVRFDDKNLTEHLVQQGALINTLPFDSNPLLCSLIANHFKVARKLLRRGANINLQNDEGKTFLMSVCRIIFHHDKLIDQREKEKIMLWLLENGADIHARDDRNWTVLHYACNLLQPDIVKLLIEHGTCVNDPIISPLVSTENSLPILLQLLQAGADVDAVAPRCRQNVLHVACFFNRPVEDVATLLYYGADKNARDRYASKPIDLATNDHVKNILAADALPVMPDILRKHGGFTNHGKKEVNLVRMLRDRQIGKK